MTIMLQSWQLTRLDRNPTAIPAVAVRLARLTGATVWAFKVVDGAGLYREFRDHQRLYIDTAHALASAGVEVAAWGYHYGRRWLGSQGPRKEAQAVLQARDILPFRRYFVDAEAEWERRAKAGDATTLTNTLKEAGLEVWLEAARYPSYHPLRWHEWAQVLNGGWAPQVYWIGAHNAAAQMERSHREYAEIAPLPFWPVLPAFVHRATGWRPSADEILQAARKAHDLGAVGFGVWKAEWLVEGWPARKPWVDAIAQAAALWADEPEPEPDPDPQPVKCDLSTARSLAETVLSAAQQLQRDSAALALKAEDLVAEIEELEAGDK